MCTCSFYISDMPIVFVVVMNVIKTNVRGFCYSNKHSSSVFFSVVRTVYRSRRSIHLNIQCASFVCLLIELSLIENLQNSRTMRTKWDHVLFIFICRMLPFNARFFLSLDGVVNMLTKRSATHFPMATLLMKLLQSYWFSCEQIFFRLQKQHFFQYFRLALIYSW